MTFLSLGHLVRFREAGQAENLSAPVRTTTKLLELNRIFRWCILTTSGLPFQLMTDRHHCPILIPPNFKLLPPLPS